MSFISRSLVVFVLITASFLICNAQAKKREGFPIYVDVVIKKSIAEFDFYTIYREKQTNDEFAEVFINQVAVTNPMLNKMEMKMIAIKRGIFYQVKVKESKQKYTLSFLHTGIRYEGEITLNPKVKSEIKQIEFWRRSGGN